ncbi:hypothetical protein B0H17DRAFT_1150319 [Mycena rosella]|uniref:Uncharacterized protein n=1 Tax=Mycena rosella TaxID=1033263 RepID=A0AAD7BV82_MYCRO|nr:hypothetical protein B0H17DRAFT_1150319 [Mycena rosella]
MTFAAVLTIILPMEEEVLQAIRDFDLGPDFMDDNDITLNINEVLDGGTPAKISHGGGEFQEVIEAEMEADRQRRNPRRKEWRTCWDRTAKRNRVFDSQMDVLVELYGIWVGKGEPTPICSCEDPEQGGFPIKANV